MECKVSLLLDSNKFYLAKQYPKPSIWLHQGHTNKHINTQKHKHTYKHTHTYTHTHKNTKTQTYIHTN